MTLIIPRKYLRWIATRQMEFSNAWTLVGYLFTIFGYETFAMMLCTRFNINAPLSTVLYIAVPLVGVIGVVYIGRVLKASGYQHEYAKALADINEDWTALVQKVDKLTEERK